jgi:defect-in-organelle-trafficking protein DotA
MSNRIFAFFFLALFSTAAVADNSPWDFFSVDTTCSSTDLSISYLIQLFGTVGNVLGASDTCGGTASQTVFGYMFSAFNIVALGLGMLMITYTIGLGILNTAESGKFLGEKLSSIWIPVRTALGTALLVPASGTGYCVAQMLMMWFIVNGIGAANTIWQYAVTWGVGSQSVQVYGVTTTDMKTAYSILQGIMNAEICREVQGNRVSGTGTPVMPISNPGSLAVNANGQVYQIIYTNSGTQNTCGIIPFNKVTSSNFQQTSKNQGLTAAQSKANNANWSLQQYTISNLPFPAPVASTPASNGSDLASMNAAGGVLAALINAAVNPDSSPITFPTGTAVTNQTAWQPYIDAARTWAYQYASQVKMSSLTNLLGDPPAIATDSTRQTLTSGGWLTAGQFYFKLVQLGAPTNTANPNQVQIPFISTVLPSFGDIQEGANLTSSTAYVNAKNLITTNLMKPLTSGTLNAGALYGGHAVDLQPVTGSNPKGVDLAQGFQNLGNAYANQTANNPMAAIGTAIMSSFTNNIANQLANGGDPIVALVAQGSSMMQITADVMIGILIAGPIAGALSGICDTVYNVMDPVMGMFITLIPIIYMVLGAVYVEGALLSVYLPLIPLMSFIVGGIGWLIAVIEAMAAAPIIAIGLTIPEGQHDILGRAEPAFLMTMNLLLRPTLMVIGFVMAVVLLRIAFSFFNQGFVEFVNDNGIKTDNIFGYAIILAAYITTIMAITQRVFGLINHLPDRVLSWIGDHGPGTQGAEGMLGEAKQGISSRGEMAGRGGGEAARGLTGSKFRSPSGSKGGGEKGGGEKGGDSIESGGGEGGGGAGGGGGGGGGA